MNKQISGGMLFIMCIPTSIYLITSLPTFDGRSYAAGIVVALGALGFATFLDGFNKETKR